MADPVPVVDAALLAAQARAGQAGVDAYKAAQAELQNQRQMSVQQAMQEAALRGAPQGSMQQVQSTITAPYDQRIASLSQASAAFQGDMAGRDRRMADYNAAVNAARSYIPQVTEQIVAPIRAEGEYRVRGIERGGEAKVSEIEANRRLTEAKMAAAFQAEQIAAAKAASAAAKAKSDKDKDLNKTELESELFGRAKQRLQQSSAAARDIIEGNRSEVQRTVANTQTRVRSGKTGTVAKNQEDAFKKWWANFASMAMAAKIAELSKQPAGPPTNTARLPVTYGTGMGGAGGLSIPVTPQPQPMQTAWDRVRSPFSSRSGTAPVPNPNADEIRKLEAGIRAFNYQGRGTAESTERREQRANSAITSSRTGAERARSFTDPTTGRRVMMTPAQLSMFSAFDQDTILGATQYGDLRSGADVDRLIGGAPGDRGIAHPYSSQALRNAMIQSAQEMVDEGYEINDAELRNALGEAESYRPGQSLYDSLARETGQPTGEEEFDMGQDIESERRRDETYDWTMQGRQGDLLDAQSDVDEQSQEADARRAILARYGFMPPSSFGNPVEIAQRVQSTEFQNSEQKLSEIFDTRGQDFIDDEIEEAMIDVGIPPEDRRLLKEFYSG